MRTLATAKWGYVTRRLVGRAETGIGQAIHRPGLGDLVVARVAGLGELEHLEDPHGRRMRLFSGDLVVGAFGNRYATDFYEGYLPGPNDPVHLLTSGGLIGTVASAHSFRAAPTVLEVVGALTDPGGRALNTDQLALAPAPAGRPALGTLVVVGSSMNAGKTTTAAALIRGLTRAGLRVGAGKVTGSGSGKDHWAYRDAGAALLADFLDFGMASTFGYPPARLTQAMVGIRDQLVGEGAEVVVLEIADGVLQGETRALAARLPGFADAVVLAVGDGLGAVAGARVLGGLGVRVRALSGLLSASPLASREATAATGLGVWTPGELADGGAVELLAAPSEQLLVAPAEQPAAVLSLSDRRPA